MSDSIKVITDFATQAEFLKYAVKGISSLYPLAARVELDTR